MTDDKIIKVNEASNHYKAKESGGERETLLSEIRKLSSKVDAMAAEISELRRSQQAKPDEISDAEHARNEAEIAEAVR